MKTSAGFPPTGITVSRESGEVRTIARLPDALSATARKRSSGVRARAPGATPTWSVLSTVRDGTSSAVTKPSPAEARYIRLESLVNAAADGSFPTGRTCSTLSCEESTIVIVDASFLAQKALHHRASRR